MKLFLIGTAMMILVAMTTIVLGYLGIKSSLLVVLLAITTCVGFILQIIALSKEHEKIKMLEADVKSEALRRKEVVTALSMRDGFRELENPYSMKTKPIKNSIKDEELN